MMSSRSYFEANTQYGKSLKYSIMLKEVRRKWMFLVSPRFPTILGERDWKGDDINYRKCRVEFSFVYLNCSRQILALIYLTGRLGIVSAQ